MTEDELDQTPPGGGTLSADINLGSHLPNPLNSPLNIKKVPCGMKVCPPGSNNGNTDKAVPSTAEVTVVGADGKRDQINNVTQKELAMSLEGVTRRKTYAVIARLLEAKKWAEVTDKGGNVRWENVDDLEKQRQGAEMALRVMGDMIEHKQVEYGIADSTLEKLKAMSVVELKKRAEELLAGRRGEVVVDAEVVEVGR